MDMFERIEKAVRNTGYVVPGYWEKTLNQRIACSSTAAGSVYEQFEDPVTLESALMVARWKPYSHPAIAPGCEAFAAFIPGRMGVVPLRDLPSDAIVVLDDRKGTGKVSAVVKGVLGPRVAFTVLILGREKDKEGNEYEIVFTFHPGEPVRPSPVDATPGLHGKKVTVAETLAMGLEMAKIE
ncbi:MAG: hypothetical protein A3H64_00430 [Candidatus Ryanbacteria bacterium RIFCSPLOWO2_02_FULL_45_11c]|uniref:Uncharacterized protein n=1 Tax=Candidatus Ryanbacteria bacterium RIFCSPLOWO2_02_FULL_45_11c TaxID=1802128 RepID=A0A1G2GVU5_9BACT|nr:MAG: hypothetical protein A3H64_00430 [Candidatus Ryanbacteria bacterium RIFCSPLOWO2_02_FULL_45_11c]